MSASTRRVRIHSWSFPAVRRGLSAGRLLVMATSLLRALPVAGRPVLRAATPVRGRKPQQEGVASLRLNEVQVGNTTLQLYRDGHTLYDAMLTAIDGARESIYLQASTWEDDEVGRAFQRHLVQKVAEGVGVQHAPHTFITNAGYKEPSHFLKPHPEASAFNQVMYPITASSLYRSCILRLTCAALWLK